MRRRGLYGNFLFLCNIHAIMSNNESKQEIFVQLQPPQQNPLPVDQRILLIRSVCKYPRLYKNEFLGRPFLQRYDKQQIWDKIAKESGFEKMEDAKYKWRYLISYLRQHLDNVGQKKTRRYMPISDNPDDKYVQLTDWPLYSELEFVVPYVKYAGIKKFGDTANQPEITLSEIDVLLEGIEEEENDNTVNPEEDLTDDEKILKEYFENMLKSTLKLPRFHQNLIKQNLQNCINEQKAKK